LPFPFPLPLPLPSLDGAAATAAGHVALTWSLNLKRKAYHEKVCGWANGES